MTLTLVVDASVVAKWYLPEADRQAALVLRDRLDELIAPDILGIEVPGAILRRHRRREITAEEAREACAFFKATPLRLEPSGPIGRQLLRSR